MKVIKDQGKSTYLPLNIVVPAILLDKDGNEIKRKSFGAALSTPQAWCDDPGSAPIPSEPSVTLVGVEHLKENCGNYPHTFTMSWIIKTPFELTDVNPNNNSQISRGRLRIKNGSTTTYQDLNIPIETGDIVLQGTDPLDSDIKIYSVSYTKSGIADSYLLDGSFTSVEVSFFIYSDCEPDAVTVSTGYYAAFSPYNIILPCLRIDNVYISPSTQLSPPPDNDYCGSIAGTDPFGACPSAPTYYINLGSEIQVKKAGDPDTDYQPLQTYATGKTDHRTDGYVFYWEVRYTEQLQNYVPNTSGISWPANFTFRWRNIDGTSTSNITCTGDWSDPVTLSVDNF